MTDNERKPRAGQPTQPDALALPHQLPPMPRSLWTPALAAFRNSNTAMPSSVRAEWPRIELFSVDLPSSVLALLAATLPLHPHVELRCSGPDVAQLASLVAVFGPALRSVRLSFWRGVVDGQGHAIATLLLQHCPRLRCVSIYINSYSQNEVDGLLAIVTHPNVKQLAVNMQGTTTIAPRLGHHLAAWLSTAPATKLDVANVTQMDHDAAVAFYDAL
ncbi:hypothetical protein SDRG_08158 [Saprolegnia diclina VS20]|uniref:F-box domain-containing protein n=1 Tax=Saprolegnia diclina (strain VS20) TaxID=1156394 RepID=T0RPG0_SAPDV|nr:hypothetical protein SDRG_08158 [Saprolegnia diclina VS20]EQC34388.1 hypothetical protein SDRG_08158 [Saprolegnia diclina VS20]|eukprot:XP_008612250.1 hypothetical protein SDRG_08158 [Saprolegnia diclina VS20]